jgi:hypothetical protein
MHCREDTPLQSLRENSSIWEVRRAHCKEAMPSPLSSRPQRTRISCHATLDEAAYAPFRKEGRMKCVNATKSNRKSGVAQWRDLQFRGHPLEMFSAFSANASDLLRSAVGRAWPPSPQSDPCASRRSTAVLGCSAWWSHPRRRPAPGTHNEAVPARKNHLPSR